MTDIQLALLGDKDAQERITERGELLPCPHCGNRDIILSNWGMFRCWCPNCHAKGEDCLAPIDAAKSWNTRSPILTETQIALLKMAEKPRRFGEGTNEKENS